MRNIIVNGRIAADVTRQLSKSGNEFISFNIANHEYGDPKSSDGVVQTQWFRITAFDNRLVNLAQYLTKGKPITVMGKYSDRLYQSQKTGQWAVSREVIADNIYFEVGSERQNGNTTQQNSNTYKATQTHVNPIDEIPQATSKVMATVQPIPTETVSDDDLPF